MKGTNNGQIRRLRKRLMRQDNAFCQKIRKGGKLLSVQGQEYYEMFVGGRPIKVPNPEYDPANSEEDAPTRFLHKWQGGGFTRVKGIRDERL